MPYAPDLAGSALDGRYELHALIGEGSFGRVYRGLDRRLARTVAIKVIKPWWSEDPDWVASFEREVQLLARVSAPGIVQIYDVGRAQEGLYYVAEYVDGESLAGRLRRGPLPVWEACETAEQLCTALAQAHAQNIVHRDIKPANVLISRHGQVKVGDFGVALLAEGSTDGGSVTIVGTPRYMAPEQARGRRPTPATDIYSVGVVLYEMLSGRPPFDGELAVDLALQHSHDAPPRLPAGIPRALTKVVDRALEKRPESRFPSATAMGDALARVRLKRSGDAPTVPVRVPTTDRTLTRRGPLWAGIEQAEAAQDGSLSGGARAAAAVPSGPGERASGEAGSPHRRASVDPTRIAPRRTPRRTVNPSARRRSIAALGLVLVLALAMLVGARVLAGPARVSVPELRGLRARAVTTDARGHGLRTVFRKSYARAPDGVAVSQVPAAGARVDDGSTVMVVLSLGPPPVDMPKLVGQTSGAARAKLASLGLHVTESQVPAPGTAAGIVTNQVPASGLLVRAHGTVELSVAEVPSWRYLTKFTGMQSVPFRIRGGQWRIVYHVGYGGVCSWLSFFCSGPSAQVVRLDPQSNLAQFGLNEGNNQVQQFQSGPGLYQIEVSPGSGSSNWWIEVEDYY